MKFQINAVIFSRLLIGLMVLLIAAGGAVFYYGGQFLQQAAIETNHETIDAEISSQDVARLKQLESELNQKQDVVARTKQIIAESQQYQYQDQVIQDINAYAARTGVSVTGYDFEDTSKSARSAVKDSTAPTLTGVKAITATVNLDAPVNYTNFLLFLKAIEQNLTKMQVTGVNVTPDADDLNAVSNPSVGIRVYVKE